MTLYVVKSVNVDDEIDYKVYVSLPDAVTLFSELEKRVYIDDLNAVNLFEVPEVTDVRKAIEAVKEGRAVVLKQDHWGRI